MSPVELSGYISAACLAACAVPAAVKAWRTGVCSMSVWFLGLWLVGEVTGVVQALALASTPLLLNRVVNTVCIVILLLHNNEPEVDLEV